MVKSIGFQISVVENGYSLTIERYNDGELNHEDYVFNNTIDLMGKLHEEVNVTRVAFNDAKHNREN